VSREVQDQLAKTELLVRLGRENVFRATEVIGEATFDALDEANKWVAHMATSEPVAPEAYLLKK
jgi:hypothetical protein